MSRDENDNQSSGDPRELHYYFNGRGIGDVSNHGNSDTEYVPPTSYPADFDQSYDPINGLNYETTATSYTVQSGDTLESIALNQWGDASFWYLIADANGLTDSSQLVAGMNIRLPNKVHNAHNTSETYRVYDPNEAIGDTSPTAVAPAQASGDDGCGVLGQILMVVVAVAVTIIASPASLSSMTFMEGVLAGAAGGAASQAVGILTGVQDSVDWKGLALSALGGGIAAGLGGVNAFGDSAKGLAAFGNNVVRGVLGNALTQGVGVATGLQDSFNWGNVAAAGVGAGVGARVGGGPVISGMAGGIAGAAATSLVTGQDFGDTLISSLPSIIGNTIGNLVAGAVTSKGRVSGGLASIDRGNHPYPATPEGIR